MIAKTIIKIAQTGVYDPAQLCDQTIGRSVRPASSRQVLAKEAASGGPKPNPPHPRSNNMTPHIPEEFFTRLIDRRPSVIMGNSMQPRDPNEDEEDEDEEEEDEEDSGDEPPVVREPDED
jgi:hypothetical protein